MNKLVPDVLPMIVNDVRKRDLANLVLASKMFRKLFRPFLYKSVHIELLDHLDTLLLLKNDKTLASYVLEFGINKKTTRAIIRQREDEKHITPHRFHSLIEALRNATFLKRLFIGFQLFISAEDQAMFAEIFQNRDQQRLEELTILDDIPGNSFPIPGLKQFIWLGCEGERNSSKSRIHSLIAQSTKLLPA